MEPDFEAPLLTRKKNATDGTRSPLPHSTRGDSNLARPEARPNFVTHSHSFAFGDASEAQSIGFMQTIAYWIAILFLYGSALFTCACFFWMLQTVNESGKRERALVSWPFLVGSLGFTAGSYLAFFEVINVGREEFVFWSLEYKKDGYWASAIFFISSVIYNINCLGFVIPHLSTTAKALLVGAAASISGLGFTVAGAIQAVKNGLLVRRQWGTVGWWLGLLNFIGGLLFLVGGISLNFEDRLRDSGYWYIAGFLYIQFLAGSVLYLVSSFLMLVLWKREQYGLGFVPKLNTHESIAALAISHVRRNNPNVTDGGIGRVDCMQMFFLVFYVALASAATTDLVFASELLINKRNVEDYTLDSHEIIHSLIGLFLSTAVLILKSVMHWHPVVPPYGGLLWLLRFISSLVFLEIILSIKYYYSISAKD
mmetsp:Transcript_6985/g.25750  ORF Transcript_6985/g.25750 Transcript_6985/m.25750 type:complete len:425 (+) Transcript_6985:221-1495(+)